MSTIIVIVSWYAGGFAVAASMIDSGRSPALWWTAAAVCGGAVAVMALASVVLARAHPVPPFPSVDVDEPHVLGVVSPDGDVEAVVDQLHPSAFGSSDRPSTPAVLVCTVPDEAFRGLVETGDLRRATETRWLAARLLGPGARTVTTSGRPDRTRPGQLGSPIIAVTDRQTLAPLGWRRTGPVLAERATRTSVARSAARSC